jgi:hypothetical protein
MPWPGFRFPKQDLFLYCFNCSDENGGSGFLTQTRHVLPEMRGLKDKLRAYFVTVQLTDLYVACNSRSRQPFKDEAYLFYMRTQCVPRCKHSPLWL